MARLQDLRPSFTILSWSDKLTYIEAYRTKRHNDLNTIQEFDLSKAKKTKSTKAREPKDPVEKRVAKMSKKTLAQLSPAELAILKQLGMG
jgi:hypothetical protein